MEEARRSSLYKAILVFALLDLATGVISLFLNGIFWQILALGVTTITLVLAVVYFCKTRKKTDAITIIIGSIDFITGLISVLLVVWITQFLVVIASGLTLFKAVKIFVQTEKASKVIESSMPIIKKAVKVIPVVAKLKSNKGDMIMAKLKEFFTKLWQNLRANKVSLVDSVLNGGVWAVLGILIENVDKVAIEVAGFNITPLFSIIGFILVELGFQWESFETFIARITPKLEAKKAAKEASKVKAQEEAAKKLEADRIAKAKALVLKKREEAEKQAKQAEEEAIIANLAAELEMRGEI